MPARRLSTDLPSTARLFVYPPAAEAFVLPLSGSLAIGRSRSNDLTLDDGRASGRHARLGQRSSDKVWEVEDLGSTNGTWIDGGRVARGELRHGSVVRLGDTFAILEIGARASDDLTLESIESVQLERRLERVAATDAPVLLLGATGAGKGHLARRIAERSSRRGRYVHVNCAALPATLVEAELFGHEKGAFTGATGAKPGLIEEADRGLLFLDEIGTLSPELQSKLLVAVEEGRLRRVGSTSDRRIDVRYLAATNVDVQGAIADGTFREDLYYRLAAHTIELPDLSRRRPDILRFFVDAAGLPDHRALSPELTEALLVWSWPGNVRELLNVAKTLEAEAGSGAHDYDVLPPQMTVFLRRRAMDDAPTASSTTRRRQMPARAELVARLEECGGNVSELARRMGKHRNQVVRWLDAYGLRK